MENRELREGFEELEICESFDMQEPRRSQRGTKGIPPRRFGFASSRHSSSESSTRRRRLQAELEYKQRRAEIQRRLAEEEAERQLELAAAEKELREAELDEEEELYREKNFRRGWEVDREISTRPGRHRWTQFTGSRRL